MDMAVGGVRQKLSMIATVTNQGPQLNPEKRLNADLKQEMDQRVPVRTKAK